MKIAAVTPLLRAAWSSSRSTMNRSSGLSAKTRCESRPTPIAAGLRRHRAHGVGQRSKVKGQTYRQKFQVEDPGTGRRFGSRFRSDTVVPMGTSASLTTANLVFDLIPLYF